MDSFVRNAGSRVDYEGMFPTAKELAMASTNRFDSADSSVKPDGDKQRCISKDGLQNRLGMTKSTPPPSEVAKADEILESMTEPSHPAIEGLD